jgi:hypothetical protein
LLSGVSKEDLTWSIEGRLYGTGLERGERVLAASMASIGQAFRKSDRQERALKRHPSDEIAFPRADAEKLNLFEFKK